MKDLVVIGGGGHAKVVIATARAAGYEVIGVLDEDETKRRQGHTGCAYYRRIGSPKKWDI